MNIPLRFRVEVDRTWDVRVLRGDGVLASDARTLRRLSTDGEPAFPLPPAGEALTSPLLRDDDPQAIVSAYNDILARRGTRVEEFGRYLFDTLIGEAAWRAIREDAAEQGARNVELALCWDRSDLELHRLNWEMMHTGDAFLAAGTPGFAVAITRVVTGTGHVVQRSLVPPARLLFVVGTSLTDPEIRPAAELVGLIRRLRRNSRRLHTRMLEHASPNRIREAIASFKPDIIHFVGHGSRDAEGRSYLELEPDDDDGDRARPASQLVQYLDRDGVLPAVVVLSACYTAGAQIVQAGAYETAPMAAELIRLGVPVVLGMAGRVSDRICRLFTRRFGEGLSQWRAARHGNRARASGRPRRRRSTRLLG
jgi:hypothetical protein